jgi:hypothetical protein
MSDKVTTLPCTEDLVYPDSDDVALDIAESGVSKF